MPQETIQGRTEVSQAISAFIKREEDSTLPKQWEQAGQEKSDCTEERRGLGINYPRNETAKYSKFRGGFIGIPRRVLANHSFPRGGGSLLSLFGP